MKTILFFIFRFLLISLSLKSQEKIALNYGSKWEITPENKATYYRKAEYNLNDFNLNVKVHDYYISDTLLMGKDMEASYSTTQQLIDHSESSKGHFYQWIYYSNHF